MSNWAAAALAAFFVAASGGAALAAKPVIPPPATVVSAPSGVKAKSVKFATYQFVQTPNLPIGNYQVGPLCIPRFQIALKDFAPRVSKEAFAQTFEREVRSAGFPLAGASVDNLFGAASDAAGDLQVAANIKSATGDVCALLYASNTMKGWMQLEVEWQIYSPIKREVVARIPITAAIEKKTPVEPGPLLTDVLDEAVKGLLNDKTYRDLMLSSAPDIVAGPGAAPAIAGGPATVAPGRDPILIGAPSRKPTGLPEVAGSVVTIVAGGGHGSGFLVSANGYILTNEHVVRGSETVKIRWSDNFETVGQVLRLDRGRDVALIKTDSRGRLPLLMSRGAIELGQEVYAVGAPLDIGLSGTVTRGIVSTSNRIFNGYSFVQSDVQVNPGNSGGPLVTKDGQVIAMTDIGYQPEGLPTGINLFIPAGDALDFLGLKPAAP